MIRIENFIEVIFAIYDGYWSIFKQEVNPQETSIPAIVVSQILNSLLND